jgi:hypothetical protein
MAKTSKHIYYKCPVFWERIDKGFLSFAFAVLLMTKTWNSIPKNLRIGPQFQGFVLNWPEILRQKIQSWVFLKRLRGFLTCKKTHGLSSREQIQMKPRHLPKHSHVFVANSFSSINCVTLLESRKTLWVFSSIWISAWKWRRQQTICFIGSPLTIKQMAKNCRAVHLGTTKQCIWLFLRISTQHPLCVLSL